MESDTQQLEAGPSDFLAERTIASGSKKVGMHVPELENELGIRVHGVIRHGAHVFARRSDIVIAAGDTLLVEGNIARFEDLETQGDFEEVGGNLAIIYLT